MRTTMPRAANLRLQMLKKIIIVEAQRPSQLRKLLYRHGMHKDRFHSKHSGHLCTACFVTGIDYTSSYLRIAAILYRYIHTQGCRLAASTTTLHRKYLQCTC